MEAFDDYAGQILGPSLKVYETTFPLTESTISEGGRWENLVPATWTAPISTVGGSPGHAVGLLSSGVNDSIARMTGVWSPNQKVTIVAYVNGTPAGAPEFEAHLRCSMTPGSPDHINTYEIDIIPGNSITVARWEGGQGNLSVIGSPIGIGAVVDGDVFECTATGPASNVLIVVKKNGTTLMSVTDNDGLGYGSGNPGMGFDAGTSADGAKLGIRKFRAEEI